MSHIPNQQREIYKIAVGLYAAAPGTSYFAELNGALEAGLTVSDLYAALANAPSFQGQDPAFGPQSTNAQFTTAFLQRLLGTDVTPAGQSFAFDFVFDRLQAGASRGEVMKIAIDALDAVPSTDPDFGAAAQRLDNRILVARSFTELFGNSSLDIQFLQSTIATVTSDTSSVNAAVATWSGGLNIIDLTPRHDVGASFIGGAGNDLFNALLSDGGQQTLNTGDALAGAGGRDTLKATIAGEDVLPILTSIENIDVGFGGTSTLDLSSASGVQQLTVEASSAVGTVSGLGGVDNLMVRDQQQDVIFDGATAPRLNLTLEDFGRPGSVHSVVFGGLSPVNAQQLDLTLADAYARLKAPSLFPFTSMSIDASGVNQLYLDTPISAVKTLEVKGSGSLDLRAAGDQLRTVILSGDTRLTVGGDFDKPVAIANVDASRSSGGIVFFGNWNTVPVVFVGSEVNDTFYATGRGRDTVDAGGGGDDIALFSGMGVRLIYDAGDSLLTSGLRRVYDSVGNFNGPLSFGVHDLDVIDLTRLGFTATETSALTDHGALDVSAIDGSTLFQPGWFVSSGEAHAVAIGTRIQPGPVIPDSDGSRLPDFPATYVFVDVNKDGDFEAATDLFIQLLNTPTVTLDNFAF